MTLLTVRQDSGQGPLESPLVDGALEPLSVRRVGYLLLLALWTVPLLIPAGPGNTAIPDVSIGAVIVMTMLWLRRKGARVFLPYSVGIGIFMVAGGIAAVHHGVPAAGLPVVQDVFMLLWAAAIANAVQRPWLLQVFLQGWCWSGIAFAAALAFGRMTGLQALAGITARNGGRAALTMNDPNLAGNYFLCCLMVLLATRAIRQRWIRFLGAILILIAIVLTGSNGAFVGLGIGLVVGGIIGIRNASGPVFAIAVVAPLLALAVAVGPHIDVSAIQQRAADNVQLLRDSLGRSNASSSEREILFSEGMRLYLGGDLIGLGPGRTKDTLAAQGASYVKEAHNDYVAGLVERGVLGGLGLIILISAVGVRTVRVTFRPLPSNVAALVPRPEYLLGLGLALLASGFFYEVLHFRHLWAFLGLVAGLDMMGRRPWPR